MIEFYPQIKSAHIHLVLLSGLLFAVRGGFSAAGAKWPRHATLRWLSYGIDTFLLTSAAMLLTILPAGMFANGWLAMKMVLLVFYVVLGVLAMRPGLSRGLRVPLYLGALACFALMFGIARMHHPLGWLHRLL
ncbi:MAG: SirB2 family protein [Pseudoxanthomonas suwonensis]|nr:SirB2 family protein [Pseudoxanthomonas suwonensis]